MDHVFFIWRGHVQCSLYFFFLHADFLFLSYFCLGDMNLVLSVG